MKTTITLLVILAIAGPTWAGGESGYSHQDDYEHYEGTATCL